jgi:hypothetical protein
MKLASSRRDGSRKMLGLGIVDAARVIKTFTTTKKRGRRITPGALFHCD